MKKSLLGVVFALVLFISCKETETTFVDITGVGIIKGTVVADTNQVATPLQSEPLAGINVRILWESEDLGVVSDGDSRTQSITVTTDENGVYTAEVPTIEDGITFEVVFDDLEIEVTHNNGVEVVTETVIFDGDNYNVTVRSEETKTRNHDYGSFANTDLEGFATISGTVVADSEQITTQDIPEAAEGATVTVEWSFGGNTKSVSTTTDASGNYSVQVPTDENDDFTVIFEDFTTTVSYFNGLQNVTGFTATFEEDSDNANGLSAGDQRVINFSYADNFVEDLPVFGTINGTVRVEVDDLTSQIDSLSNITLRFTWVDVDNITQGTTTTTDDNGFYSADVPLTYDNDIDVTVSMITVTDYPFNNGTDDVVGTAIYSETEQTVFNIEVGETKTQIFTITTPFQQLEN